MLRKHEEDSDLGKGRAIAKAQKTLMKQTEIQWLGQDGRLFLSQVTDQGWAGVPGMWAALLCSALQDSFLSRCPALHRAVSYSTCSKLAHTTASTSQPLGKGKMKWGASNVPMKMSSRSDTHDLCSHPIG